MGGFVESLLGGYATIRKGSADRRPNYVGPPRIPNDCAADPAQCCVRSQIRRGGRTLRDRGGLRVGEDLKQHLKQDHEIHQHRSRGALTSVRPRTALARPESNARPCTKTRKGTGRRLVPRRPVRLAPPGGGLRDAHRLHVDVTRRLRLGGRIQGNCDRMPRVRRCPPATQSGPSVEEDTGCCSTSIQAF